MLRTQGDIRASRAEHLASFTDRVNEAARGGNINDAVISLRVVLQLERVPCLPQ